MTDTGSRVPDQRQLQPITINDFSPGCYDSSWIIGSTPTFAPGPYPAPLGAADANQTHGCMALPTGGLGPLPKMVQSHSMGDFNMTTPRATTFTAFCSTLMNGNYSGGDELVVIQTYDATGSGSYSAFLNSFLWNTTGAGHNLATLTGKNLPFVTAYPFMTRVATSNPTTTPGTPVLVVPISNFTKNSQFGIYLYPDPAAPTTYGTTTLSIGSDWFGMAFGHQGRICALVQINGSTAWPTPSQGFLGYYDGTSFTDPPNSETWGSQDEIFGPEEPFGYGAVTSVSAGEVFLIKTNGGAVIVQGDINNPTVTHLPAVKSTGPIFGHSAADPNGTYYCSQDEGAWVWNGGNASVKISKQLDDAFFGVANPIPPEPGFIDPYGYFVERWGEWMMFSNNWIYNPASGGWWRLYDPSVASFFFYARGFNHNILYACVPLAPNTNSQCFYQFDRTVGTNAWQWQSLPIRPNSADRTVSLREVTLRASNPTLDANAQIQVFGVDQAGTAHPASSTWTLDSTTRGVQIHNFSFGVRSEDIVLRIAATGTTTAPTLYDIVVQYRAREQAARI